MYKIILALTLLFITTTSFSQTIETRYFSDKYLSKETTAEKAKFKQTVTQLTDGAITTEVINLKNNEVVRMVAYKAGEPVGMWKFNGETKDYSFDLIYSDASCTDTIAGLRDYFQDNPALKYTAPKIATGERTIADYIARNLRYPGAAFENNIQGKVLLTLRMSAAVKVESIVVKKGVHPVLDKEAVFLIRQLLFSKPPIYNGKPTDICFTLPLSFRLE